MFLRSTLSFVWLVGIEDCLLTQWFVGQLGPESELNAVARIWIGLFGLQSLFLYKGLLLGLFTYCILRGRRSGLQVSRRGLLAACGISIFLMCWWDQTLRMYSSLPGTLMQ